MCGERLKGLRVFFQIAYNISKEWLMVVMIHFGNVDVHHVQTSGNTFNGIDNDKSGLLITPYLGIFLQKLV